MFPSLDMPATGGVAPVGNGQGGLSSTSGFVGDGTVKILPSELLLLTFTPTAVLEEPRPTSR